MTAGLIAALLPFAGAGAAELPARAPAAQTARHGASEPTKALPRCDVGGVQGVMTPAGVCLRMSGYVSAGVWGGAVK